MIYLYVFFALIAVLVIAGLVIPSRYAFTRSTTIEASAAAVHAYVGHLDKWPEWMPWEKDDPSVITKLGDKTTGVGAAQAWSSSRSGDGEVEFTACDEDTGIAYDMVFISKGKRAPAKATIRYTPVSGGTQVTWSMSGDLASMMLPVLRGLMKPVMAVMIGKNFDRGLASLKETVEAV